MKPKPRFSAELRRALIVAVIHQAQSISSQCRRLGISRQSAHRWLQRYRQRGWEGLANQSTRPRHQPHQLPELWVERLIGARRSHPTWGPKKLLPRMLPSARSKPPCSTRTLGRWLQRLRLSSRPRHRARPGPPVKVRGLSLATRPHEVWTVDFKGWVRTQDGCRWHPLTVRDLYSRMGLAVHLLAQPTDRSVRAVMRRLFIRHGLPRAIRVDNGAPFASRGPLHLSQLSLWWRQLGIQVDFTRRAAPQDNGSHEQFHRVYKAEVLHRPSPHRSCLQRRTNRWLWHYNHQRPHEALHQRTPATYYRKNPRRYRPLPADPVYPQSWKVVRVTAKGYIRWQGRVRLLSEIAAGLKIGLKPHSQGHCSVYAGTVLIGALHPHDKAGMRPAVRCH